MSHYISLQKNPQKPELANQSLQLPLSLQESQRAQSNPREAITNTGITFSSFLGAGTTWPAHLIRARWKTPAP